MERAAAARGVILVVDDDAGNRDVLARRLAREGYEVRTAANGEAALSALAGSGGAPVDLALLDVMMPGMDGYELLRRMKADAALRDIPVLMISALDQLESVVRCIELGAEDYLPKPFEPVLLRARIGACLEKKRLRDQDARRARELAEWNETLERRVSEQVAQLERLSRLKRFFSPQLAEAIVAGGAEDPLRSHRREITVVFLDLRGFTAFAETAEPEELMGLLAEYHSEMGRLILAHEGTLERFTGDGLMVFFNDPVPVPDPAARATRMAIAMRDRVAELAAGWQRRGYRSRRGHRHRAGLCDARRHRLRGAARLRRDRHRHQPGRAAVRGSRGRPGPRLAARGRRGGRPRRRRADGTAQPEGLRPPGAGLRRGRPRDPRVNSIQPLRVDEDQERSFSSRSPLGPTPRAIPR